MQTVDQEQDAADAKRKTRAEGTTDVLEPIPDRTRAARGADDLTEQPPLLDVAAFRSVLSNLIRARTHQFSGEHLAIVKIMAT